MDSLIKMRKNQILLTVLALFLCSAVAVQAQGVYEVFSNAVKARAGGAREKAGEVVLFLRTGVHNSGVVTVTFSAPIAEGLTVSTEGIALSGGGSAAVDVKKGTVTITMPSSGEGSVTLSGVRLDVREAEAPVTAMFSGDSSAFLSGAANVISSIEDGLEVESTTKALLTRGDMGMANVTITEAFATAFTAGTGRVHLQISGVPDKAKLDVSLANYPTAEAITASDDQGAALIAAASDVAGDVTLNAGTANALIIDDGVAQDPAGIALNLTGDGKDIDITIDFADPGPAAAAVESLELVLDLDASSAVEDIELPISPGTVQVMATMAPTKKPTLVAPDSEYFAENFIAAEKASFTFAPASCTLLYPYVTYLPEIGWNTAIAVTNPSAFTKTPLSGAITFTLYPNHGLPVVTAGGPPGAGLDADGSLPAGNTYTVLLSQLLSWANYPGDFQGHLYVKTDFTGCRGLGWVTDWRSANQAYLPYFEDNNDRGNVPVN